MTEAEAKTRIQQVIKTKVKPDADKAFAGTLKAVPDLAKSIAKVNDAVKKAVDADLVKTYLRELTINVRAVSDARGYAVDALKTLADETSDDGDFKADMDEIEKLQAKLEAVRDKLSDQIVLAKKAADSGAKAADERAHGEKAAHREWDSIIAAFESSMAFVTTYLKDMRASMQEAKDAVAKRDAAALKKANDGLKRMASNPDVAAGKFLLNRAADFMKRYDKTTFSEEFQAELADDQKKIIGEYDKRAQSMQAESQKIMADMAKLSIEPPSAVKCTAELGFKANFISRVERALKLDEAKLMKELEAIGKDAGVKGTGKELLDKLKKKGYYP